MSIFKLVSKGDFNNITNFCKRMDKRDMRDILEEYAEYGVQTLSAATPRKTGLTASSWGYEIKQTSDGYNIYWTNSNENDGVNIALILQYGHGTRNGGYYEGLDYINPATQKAMLGLAEAIWDEVKSA